MDRESISSYGWIILAVIIITLLLAFGRPLGQFLSDGVDESMSTIGHNATQMSEKTSN